ncbi:DUF72 domain-containing protein [Antrihabitans cavernicola]|uniref:DUF72 domain-containing protein n=1 Tax=Antrihabitans cavernicola TaxID=2495913 RepID=A0A5A7SGC1_9NOCA|nr:DUF72 domain-containing protein [Spelaeibacter cavernicola]KAA0024624.1 DUF72 domain-containing protein [Spelaeibacter cavernicola]
MSMIRVGTSGWVYPPWRDSFYPKGLAHRRELEYMAQRLDSVEINGSFYALQKPSSYLKWSEQTPDDFVFSVKSPRFITHMKRLVDVDEPLATFFASGILALGPKLGPLLWQLPPNLAFNADTLAAFAAQLPKTTAAAAEFAGRHGDKVADRAWTTTDADRPLRHAIEVRSPSFAVPDVPEILRANNIALVIADSAGKYPYFEDLTADFVYARMHGAEEMYVSGYTDEALGNWADKLRTWTAGGDGYVYFDNDVKVRSPYDAMGLRERLAE